jgi:hypothetical protein
LKRIEQFVQAVELFIARGGLELVPEDLKIAVEYLPTFLLAYHLALRHTRRLTNAKTRVGPQGCDRRALARLAFYVKQQTGQFHTTNVIRVLNEASDGSIDIDPRVYRRFVTSCLTRTQS